MTGGRRVALGALAAGAIVAVVASRDAWFDEPPGFSAPDLTAAWMLDAGAAALGVCAVLAGLRASAVLERLAVLTGLLVTGALLGMLAAYGTGMDEPARGGWLAAVAAATTGAGSAYLLMLDGALRPVIRRGVVAVMVAVAAAAVLLPPDWSHPEVQIIR